MRLIRILVLSTLGVVPSLIAGPCTTAALSVYDGGGFTCTQTIGLETYTLKDVSYSFISGTVTIADSAITVTPVTGVTSIYGSTLPFFGLKFSSGLLSVAGTDSAKYQLTYFWDPGNIRGFFDTLDDPVVDPALAQITTDLCFNGEFGVVCPPAPVTATVTVFDNGTTSQLVGHSPLLMGPPCIPPLCTLGVRDTIELDGGGPGNSAAFTDFVDQVVVGPEPRTWISGFLVLALLLPRFRRRGARSID
jgi:hypothetical protein